MDFDEDKVEEIKRRIIFGVRYRNPPKHGQFQMGQSGNPKGRPARKADVANTMDTELGQNATEMRRVLLEPVKLRDNGKQRLISKAEAVQRNLEKQAFAGSILATRDLKKQLQDEDARRHAELLADRTVWQAYIETCEAKILEHKRTCVAITGFWIIPEDITFHPGRLTSFRGPLCAEEVEDHKTMQWLLQALLAKYMYDRKFYPQYMTAHPETTTFLMLYWAYTNKRLSAQMERENEAYWDKLEKLLVFGTGHDFIMEVKSAWAALGAPAPLKRPMSPVDPATF